MEHQESRDLLKEFVAVVHDVIPMLDQMKSSIHESSHKIPMASSQLSSVAQATETATVEILNVLDSMTQGITESETILADLAGRQSDLQTIGGELTRWLHEIAVQQPSVPGLIEVQKLWSEYAGRTSDADALAKANTVLAGVRSQTMSIAMALQVQDITAQQIAGVIHLIESVRAQLTQVLANLERNATGGVDWKSGNCSPTSSDQAFNADAQYVRGPERQEIADNIINEWGNHNPK